MYKSTRITLFWNYITFIVDSRTTGFVSVNPWMMWGKILSFTVAGWRYSTNVSIYPKKESLNEIKCTVTYNTRILDNCWSGFEYKMFFKKIP